MAQQPFIEGHHASMPRAPLQSRCLHLQTIYVEPSSGTTSQTVMASSLVMAQSKTPARISLFVKQRSLGTSHKRSSGVQEKARQWSSASWKERRVEKLSMLQALAADRFSAEPTPQIDTCSRAAGSTGKDSSLP